jgi:hypothetical protein
VIVTFDALKGIVIPQRRLGNVYTAMRIPFCIVSPGEINFLDEMLFLFLLRAAAVREKKSNEYDRGNALPDANF